MEYSIPQIIEVLQAEIVQQNGPLAIQEIAIDSRKIIFPNESIFFAIVGKYKNGHDFIAQAYEAGVRTFVLSDKSSSLKLGNDCTILQVENTMQALHALVRYHRNKFAYPVIGITGSNGKTIVKEWLSQLISTDKSVIKSPQSYNSQVGVPLSVWQMQEHHQWAIFEAGISEMNEMHFLQKMIQPKYGIFTNLGAAHSENFSSLEQKFLEKIQLFQHSEWVVYNSDDEALQACVEEYRMRTETRFISWGNNADATYQKIHNEKLGQQTAVTFLYQQEKISVLLPFVDKASVQNALNAWVFLHTLGWDKEVLQNRILQLKSLPMRQEIKNGKNNCTIINDTYSADINSLRIALDTLVHLQQHQKKTLILSDLLQTGENDQVLYHQVADLLREKQVRKFIGIGPQLMQNQEAFDEIEAYFFTSVSAFQEQLHQLGFSQEDILIKGARKFEFEKITHLLEEKSHQTVMEINLNAMMHNLNVYRQMLAPATKLMVMVKASAYGAGSAEIANMLQYQKIDYLTVAYADEGVELRQAGITLPIMVMRPETAHFDVMIQHQLEPEIYNLHSFEAYVKTAALYEKAPGMHLKIDTGMHRLGFELHDLPSLKELLQKHAEIRVNSIFTHLAAADGKEHDAFTLQQIKIYDQANAEITSVLNYQPLRHVLNTSGIMRFPEHQKDMVRLGIGFYGISSVPEFQEKLEDVMTLKSVVAQIRKVKKGESIGYSRSSICEKESLIATVPVGYADGLSRKLSNGKGRMFINGKFAPIIGRICMDLTMIDVTDIACVEGDEVEILGKNITIDEMAERLETIPYEIIVGISSRVKRVYVQD